jgi:hypothetical protein
MIRKLLCLLGAHKWKIKYNAYCEYPSERCPYKNRCCKDCIFYKLYTKECIYCGRAK